MISGLQPPLKPKPTLVSSSSGSGRTASRGGRSIDISGTVPLLLVLVGIPGSGKSTFVQELLTSSPPDLEWSRVSQDVLGTRKRCIRAAQDALIEGRHVAIDRCNFDQEQRAQIALSQPTCPGGSEQYALIYLI